MLGRFHVVLSSQPDLPIKFRSRTAERLLTSLALRLKHSVHKSELFEALWPDSDGDRQSQNLRRALSDIRHVLEVDSRSAMVVRSQGDRLWLDSELVHTDVDTFRQLTDAGLENSHPESHLKAAILTYGGPLLAEQEDPWLQVHRMELEERFAQAVEQLIALLLSAERFDEALRIGRQAVIAAPMREDVHLALMRAYASAGLRSEAIRQFEELETLLSDHWGATPSARSVEVFESLWNATGDSKPMFLPVQESQKRETTGGAMPIVSPFYITRDCDQLLKAAIESSEGTVLVHGARQVGKTSLLSRVLNEAKSHGLSVAVTDFQVLSRSHLEDPDAFSRALAYGFATQLGIPLDVGAAWNEWIGPNMNLHAMVESVLKQIQGPVVWAIDEADRMFGVDFADDFFGLIRSWFNLRAMDASGPFSRLTLIISYATEAHLFIQDINQSPFNVGLRISVRDFDEAQTRELGHRYGAKLSDAEVRGIWELTAGQPFLTRKAFDAIVHDGADLKHLKSTLASQDGPFGEHLRRLLHVASRDPQTKSEVVRFLKGESFTDPKTPLRLIAGGMLSRTMGGALRFRVPCYRDFLAEYLLGTV